MPTDFTDSSMFAICKCQSLVMRCFYYVSVPSKDNSNRMMEVCIQTIRSACRRQFILKTDDPEPPCPRAHSPARCRGKCQLPTTGSFLSCPLSWSPISTRISKTMVIHPSTPHYPLNYAVNRFHKTKGPTAGPNPNGGRSDKEVVPAKQNIRR